ncbi:MAG: hypothetical protein ACPKPY_12550 [Nitrososphaeraceae archaeon]
MKKNNDHSKSRIMVTQYANRSAEILNSTAKNYYIIIIVIGIMIIFSILDILAEIHYPVISDYLNDLIIMILAISSVILLSLLLSIILKWKNMMVLWSDLFEHNSIVTEVKILMNKRSKEDALVAIANLFDDMSHSLLSYLESDQNKRNLLDVKINENIIFDILIDPDRIIRSNIKGLKQILEEKGSIIIKIIDEQVNSNDVLFFNNKVKEYHLRSKRKIRLALIIGKSINPNAEKISQKIINKNKYIENFLLVEKNN